MLTVSERVRQIKRAISPRMNAMHSSRKFYIPTPYQGISCRYTIMKYGAGMSMAVVIINRMYSLDQCTH